MMTSTHTHIVSESRYNINMLGEENQNNDKKLGFNIDSGTEEKLPNDPKMKGKLSQWKNSGSQPLTTQTINELFTEKAIKFGNQVAVISVHQNSRLTFKQTYEQVESFAAGLIALGLQKGQHVGIWAPNVIEWYISIFSIFKAGLIAVNLNPLYEYPELQSAAVKTDLSAIILGETLNDRNYYSMMEKIIPNLSSFKNSTQISSDQLPKLKILITISEKNLGGSYRWCDVPSFANYHHNDKLQQLQTEIDCYDVCSMQFTSGTTGNLKAACLTHHNIVNNSYFIGKRMQLHSKEHILCCQVPLFHSFGTVLGLLVSLHYGVTIVLPSPKFSPTKSLEAIIREKCTILYGTPTMYIDLITILNKMAATDPTVYKKISSLEIAITAGSICTPEVFRKMKYFFRFKNIYSGYGMTEVSPIAFFSQSTDDEHLITKTIGCVIDHTEIRVINDFGHTVPLGVAGECCFRGYGVMRGYYKDPEINSKAYLPGGWLRSGDRFILLENGYGQVVGRIKDTIIRGGENIEPVEIETVLATHPDIINVQVFPVSDARLGETIAASIIKQEGSTLTDDEIRKYCEGKIAPYKFPVYVQFLEDYPRSATGKVLKFRLRENLERTLNIPSISKSSAAART